MPHFEFCFRIESTARMTCRWCHFFSFLILLVSNIHFISTIATVLDTYSLLEEYTFDTASCSESLFSSNASSSPNNTSLSYLNLDLIVQNNSGIRCLPGLGITAEGVDGKLNNNIIQGVTTKDTIGNKWDEFRQQHHGITFEIWYKSPSYHGFNKTEVQYPILTIGLNRSSEEYSSHGLTSCDKHGYDLQISQYSDFIIDVSFRTSDPFFEPCQHFQFIDRSIETNKLTHLVVSLSDKNQIIYINGNQGIQMFEPFESDLKHWTLHDDVINIFGNGFNDIRNDSTIWTGILYRIAFYVGPMSTSDVIERIKRGLPPSGIYALNQTVLLFEDAENIPGSHEISWYEQEHLGVYGVTPLNISMVTSVDDDVYDLLHSMNVTSGIASIPQTFVYITKLPSLGRLYEENGKSLVEPNQDPVDDIIPLGIDRHIRLIYLPPFNAHSSSIDTPFTDFTYCISQVEIFNAGNCESTATIELIVLSVNDPPAALDVPTITVVEADQAFSSNIPLFGVDVDNNDYITQVQVTQPPKYGILILSVTQFRKDGLYHGKALSELEYTVDGQDPVYVMYHLDRMNSVQEVPAIRGNTTKDFFMFRVKDKENMWSSEKRVNIQLQSSIVVGIIGSSITFREGIESKYLRWIAKDYIGSIREIQFLVEKIPSKEIGILLDPVTNNIVQTGNMIRSQTNQTSDYHFVDVYFRPPNNYCNSPHANGSILSSDIGIKAVAFAEDASTIVSVSDSILQKIQISCILDIVSFKVEPLTISIVESSLERIVNDLCFENISESTVPRNDNAFCDADVVINGIDIQTNSVKSQEVLVTVSSEFGYITLNNESWTLAEHVYGRRSMCFGNITFYSYPDDLDSILTNLQYTSFIPGNDTIAIKLRYGDCIKERNLHLTLPPCQTIRNTIAINIMRDPNKYKAKTKIVVGFPWQITLCIFGYPILYVTWVLLRTSTKTREDDATATMLGTVDYPLEKWIQHEADDGMYYYENTEDGTVTWKAPLPDEDVICRPAVSP